MPNPFLVIDQNTDVVYEMTVYSDADQTQVQDLTGFSIVSYTLGKFDPDANVTIRLSDSATPNGSVVAFVEPRTEGKVRIQIDHLDNVDFPPEDLIHELILANALGERGKVYTDEVRVRQTL
ncbi:MAG: hypothetical protein NXH95_13670 [Pseudomonadaceae bacterium]|nr:hypothetical protein [Pseudomonadaceae bacterium]